MSDTLKIPRDVYVSFWRASIERYRQSARICKATGEYGRRRYIAICRKRAGQALRAHGATYRAEEETEDVSHS